jgi:hypothetical protein
MYTAAKETATGHARYLPVQSLGRSPAFSVDFGARRNTTFTRATCGKFDRDGMEANMEYRMLGKDGIKVSVVTFGAWAIGGWLWGGTDQKAAVSAIRKGFDLGITSVDTAPAYGFGLSEKIVGEAIRGFSPSSGFAGTSKRVNSSSTRRTPKENRCRCTSTPAGRA